MAESDTRLPGVSANRVGRAVAQARMGVPYPDWQIVDGKKLTDQEIALAVRQKADLEKGDIDAKQRAIFDEQQAAPAVTQSGYGNVQRSNRGTPSPTAEAAALLGLPANATVAEIARRAIEEKVAMSVGAPTEAEARVLRKAPTGIKTKQYTGPPQSGPRAGYSLYPSAPISSYRGEYGQKIEDDEFREWMKRRAVVLGNADPKNQALLLTAGSNLWANAGDFVAANPQLRLSKTPEQWIDYQYQLAGGDMAYEEAIKEANPITHNRQVTTYSVNAAEAQAAINDMSEALLGRMASNSELKKARGAMQKLLTPTVTNTTTDATDPANVQTRSHTKAGVGPADAQKLLEMRMKRGSEGMAMNVGQMFEQAMSRM